MPTYHATTVYESLTGRVALAHVCERYPGSFEADAGNDSSKRALDLVLLVLLAPLLLPLMLLVALAVKIDAPKEPILFCQERVGLGGRTFCMLKFRSMRSDAAAKGAQYARPRDARVTRVGHFIRKYRLDELPQMWNVLRGEMSLIGPRPEQVPFVEEYARDLPFYRCRHLVRPGITGWAQVNQGYTADALETRVKLEYDLYYIRHHSLWLDLLIVIKTVGVIFTGYGAR
jgi:exopolysaccharide biosynthesis polyprenyl glycosylphosphotransferase